MSNVTVINKFDSIHTTNRLFFSSQGNFEVVIDVVDDDTVRFPHQRIDTVLIELTVANDSSTSLTFQGLLDRIVKFNRSTFVP